VHDRGETYRSVWRDMMEVDFRQGYVQAAGLRTRYVVAGSSENPPVVLLHPTGGHWEVFSGNIPALARDFQCFALDMISCGFTEKIDRANEIPHYVDHVLSFMDAMGISQSALVGISLGSWVSARLAHDHPDRVTRMILTSPAGLLAGITPATKAMVDSATVSPAVPDWDKVATSAHFLLYRPESMIDDVVAIRYDIRRRPGRSRPLALFDPEIRQRNLLTETEWKEITTPTLVVEHVDSEDEYLETARQIATLMPNASSVPMHEVSHWAPFERPDEFNAIATPFLQTGAAPERGR
jgi:2-hydroxy-6-oxonona-2,4-dienedioate hydrolase